MKKVYIILGVIIVIVSTILLIFTNQNKNQYVNYNGMQLALLVDGEKVNTLPTGKYFLISYSCNNDTELIWDYDTSTLKSKNISINDSCTLEFESSPKLYDLVELGDYISYTGDSTNGCSGNQCSGWNASQTNTDVYENYGYCYSANYKYYVYGWRVLYKTDNSVYIVSAGAPECVAGTSDDPTTNKTNLNTAALKYCNVLYLDGGECTTDTAHALNGKDFTLFTSQYNGSSNVRYLNAYEDSNASSSTTCNKAGQTRNCGYNNYVIDNGGYYWFSSAASATETFFWYPRYRYVDTFSSDYAHGVRPVLKLDSSILATGGAGTMTNPYTISHRVTE